MPSIAEKTKKSLFWQTIIQPFWEVFRFFLSVYIARLLTPKDYGIMGVASIIILYTNSLTELGFGNALIHKPDIDKRHIDTVFTVNFSISVVLTFLICMFSNHIARVFTTPELVNVLRVLSLLFIFTSFSQVSITLLRKELEYKKFTIINFIKSLIQISTTLLLAYWHFEYWALIIGYVISEFLNSVILLYAHKYKPRLHFNRDAFNSLFNYGIWNFMIAQLFTLYGYAEKAIIGGFLGPILLGLYDKAYSIAYMPIDSISMKINGVMFSSFNQYKSKRDELCNAFYNISVITSLVCFPIFGGLIIVSHDFVKIAFGEKWLSMVPVLKILLFAFIFRVPSGLLSSLNMAMGDYKLYIKAQVIVYLLTIVVYFPAVKYGIEAIGLVIIITNFLIFIISLYLSKKFVNELSIWEYISCLLPASVNTCFMVLIVFVVSRYIIFSSELFNFLLHVSTGIITYLIMLFVIKYKDTKKIRDRIHQKMNIFRSYS